MATFTSTTAAPTKAKVDVLAIFATQGDKAPEMVSSADAVAAALGETLISGLESLNFGGEAGAVARVPSRGAVAAPTVLVIGLGEAGAVNLEGLRRAAAGAADAANAAESLAVVAPQIDGIEPADEAEALVTGAHLALYRFTAYKSGEDGTALAKVAIHGVGAATKRGVVAGTAVAKAASLVRDLVNEPPAGKRPPELAKTVRTAMRGSGITVKIIDEKALLKGGYGGLIGVGQGSGEQAPPRLVELHYRPEGAKKHVVLVGKGITFDSGGLSLKPSNSMVTMKMDMAGAATVAGVVRAAADLGVKVNITGILALAENMPSGTAIRPSDVLTMRDGTTVEVLNTDAEGRLVLADSLVHASAMKPDYIVDMATLTGAVVSALGRRIGGLMATNDDLADDLLAASAVAGEPLWRLPMALDLYGDELKGDIADIKNSGWSDAGTIRAAIFLEHFVTDGIPWAHLDIAGLAWTAADSGYIRKGGTASPMRTVLGWLRGL